MLVGRLTRQAVSAEDVDTPWSLRFSGEASCSTARLVCLIYTHLGTHCHGLPPTRGACSAGSEAVPE